MTEKRLLREEEDEALATFVQDRQRDYHLGVVEVFSTTGEALVVAVNPDIPAANFSRPTAIWSRRRWRATRPRASRKSWAAR